jgi:hypothetical protein
MGLMLFSLVLVRVFLLKLLSAYSSFVYMQIIITPSTSTKIKGGLE